MVEGFVRGVARAQGDIFAEVGAMQGGVIPPGKTFGAVGAPGTKRTDTAGIASHGRVSADEGGVDVRR